MRRVVVRRLGRVEYEDGLALQQALAKARDEGRIPDTLLLLEHPPVLTRGRGGKLENLLGSPEALAAAGIEVFETDRGGDFTYHGPGQLVGYPILDLKPDRQDVRKYVRNVEELLIRTVGHFGIEAQRIAKWTGVWVGAEEDPAAVKVAAIGVHLKRWITTHGFALNIEPDLSHFRMIVPCGIRERGVGSLAALLGRHIALSEIEPVAARVFGEVFESEVDSVGVDARTVAVAVLRPGRDGLEVLVLRRTAARGGFLQLVTGRVEEGETPAAAARRELFEETGLDLEPVALDYVHTFGFGERPLVIEEHGFGVLAPAGASSRLAPAEHVEASWIPVNEAEELLPFRGLRRTLQLSRGRILASAVV